MGLRTLSSSDSSLHSPVPLELYPRTRARTPITSLPRPCRYFSFSCEAHRVDSKKRATGLGRLGGGVWVE